MSNPFDMADACPPQTTIQRAGSHLARAPEGVSNRSFWVESLLSSRTDGEITAMRVVADPGTITHWHSHPRGQLLFVLEGVGRVQSAGGAVVEVRAGDSVWFAPGDRHWHGATAGSTFSYLSIQGVENGTAVRWIEPVEATGDMI